MRECGTMRQCTACVAPNELSCLYSQSHLGCHFRKLKAQSSNVSFATFQWKETFELWALKQHPKMCPKWDWMYIHVYIYDMLIYMTGCHVYDDSKWNVNVMQVMEWDVRVTCTALSHCNICTRDSNATVQYVMMQHTKERFECNSTVCNALSSMRQKLECDSAVSTVQCVTRAPACVSACMTCMHWRVTREVHLRISKACLKRNVSPHLSSDMHAGARMQQCIDSFIHACIKEEWVTSNAHALHALCCRIVITCAACTVLSQCTSVCNSTRVAFRRVARTHLRDATHRNRMRNAVYSVCTSAHCNTLQHTATHCNTLQHTATHCNTLQHTAAPCNRMRKAVYSVCTSASATPQWVIDTWVTTSNYTVHHMRDYTLSRIPHRVPYAHLRARHRNVAFRCVALADEWRRCGKRYTVYADCSWKPREWGMRKI